MGAAILENLAALTITYNDVQFGGNDSAYKSTPPQYRFRGEFDWDDSRRSIKGTRYTLTVTSVFYENSQTAMANNANDLKQKLSVPGRQLKIVGLGTGFETISADQDWGPRPLYCDWQPFGQNSFELVWVVSFYVKECPNSSQVSPLALAAFNFDTTWQNDFEGLTSRTIAGYAEIFVRRNPANPKIILNVADEIRERINIIVPPGFQRVRNVWRENDAKNRLEFVVTDEVLPGEALPPGIIAGSGEVSYSSEGPGFSKANVTLSMSLRVSPSFPRSLAGVIFLAAAKSKQEAIQTGLGTNNKATVVPRSIYISNGKFDRARDSRFSITWSLTKCIGSMMEAAGIWLPVAGGNYNLWRTSIENLWNNRGAGQVGGQKIGSLASEAVIIDLCDNVQQVTIGQSGTVSSPGDQKPNFNFTCPNIPEDGGWITHELRTRVHRSDKQTIHQKALGYNPTPGQSSGGSGTQDTTPLGGPDYTISQGEEPDVEYHGRPTHLILVEFRGLRMKHKPVMPELKTIAGNPVILVEQQIDGPRIAFDAAPCPVWFIRGWRLYRVLGTVPKIKSVESETSCAAPNVTQDQ